MDAGKAQSTTMTNQTSEDLVLEAKWQLAIRVVERLLATCQKHEHAIWLSRYVDVLNSLRQGDLQAAIFRESRIENDTGLEYLQPVWIVSREFARDVSKAIRRIRTHIQYGDKREPLALNCEPVDVESKGTIEQERERIMEQIRASCRHRPGRADRAPGRCPAGDYPLSWFTTHRP
jgi:hypothetical protein